MNFELFPILDQLLPIYDITRGQERFAKYLALLQGVSKSDMERPIAGFNPMGKPEYIEKIRALKQLNVEQIIEEVCVELNRLAKGESSDQQFRVAFNLLDDVQGSWSNRFTADYDNRFKLNPLVTRAFCLAIFWASETPSEDQIYHRIFEAGLRSWYFATHHRPTTLRDHIEQEAWVAKMNPTQLKVTQVEKMTELFGQLQSSETFPEIFAFLYGDDAARTLGHRPIGVDLPFGGLEFAKTQQKSVG